MSQVKTPADSLAVMTELVHPNHTNLLGNLHGGQLLYWMDICSAISATKHCKATVVTASVDNVSFQNPIKLGDLVTIQSKVTRTFRTSMEVFIEVWAENMPELVRIKTHEAYYTFVRLDRNGRPAPVEEIVPQTEQEKLLYAGALRRRQLRLILGGRMKVEDATELRELFMGKP
jgi:acyl-CoA hydrolase